MATNSHSLDFELDSSQYAYSADSVDTSVTGDFTSEAWIKPESLTATHAWVTKFAYSAPYESQKSYAIYYKNATQEIEVNMTSNGVDDVVKAVSYTLSAGTWYHIAFVYTASTGGGEFYVNGSSIGTVTGFPTSIHNGTNPYTIGATNTGQANFFDGLIDDVRLWNDVRTAGEISANYQCQLVGNEQGLVAYHLLNNQAEDKGETTDPTGAVADDLTLVNTPVYSTTVPFAGGTCGAVAGVATAPRGFMNLNKYWG